jgi:hypothetical protein
VKHVSVRLDEEIIARVDALRPHYSKPWRKVTRSDLLLIVILAGLEVEDPSGKLPTPAAPAKSPAPVPPAKKRRSR